MTDQQQYQEIKQRVKQISAFFQHLVVYILVNAGLIVINLMTSPNEIWFTYPLFGWGIGVAVHALNVFIAEGLTKSWEEKKIRELMAKESRQN